MVDYEKFQTWAISHGWLRFKSSLYETDELSESWITPQGRLVIATFRTAILLHISEAGRE